MAYFLFRRRPSICKALRALGVEEEEEEGPGLLAWDSEEEPGVFESLSEDIDGAQCDYDLWTSFTTPLF